MRLLLVEDDSMIGAAAQRGPAARGPRRRLGARRPGRPRPRSRRGVHDDGAARPGPAAARRPLDPARRARARGVDVPVIIITARDAVSGPHRRPRRGRRRLPGEALRPGRALGARARGGAPPRGPRPTRCCASATLEIDTATRRVRWQGRRRGRSRRASTRCSRRSPTAPAPILSRAQLEERLYGWDEEIASNAVEVHIHALRRKLDPELIRNVRGLGYTLAADAPDVDAPPAARLAAHQRAAGRPCRRRGRVLPGARARRTSSSTTSCASSRSRCATATISPSAARRGAAGRGGAATS